MVRRLLAAASAIAFCLGAAPEAQQPAPAALAPSDVTRGVQAAAACESLTWSTEDYSACVDGAVGHAMNNDQASMSFQLGIYCAAFFTLAQAHHSQSWKRLRVDIDSARTATVDQYDSCAYSARRLRLRSSRICTVIGLGCAAFDRTLRHWRRVSRSGM